ncbi:hypothetical protein HRbin28_00317 [bacterium HR28]|nr:hypothetical protein HRbin28_00317 [bacterium HR28]
MKAKKALSLVQLPFACPDDWPVSRLVPWEAPLLETVHAGRAVGHQRSEQPGIASVHNRPPRVSLHPGQPGEAAHSFSPERQPFRLTFGQGGVCRNFPREEQGAR